MIQKDKTLLMIITLTDNLIGKFHIKIFKGTIDIHYIYITIEIINYIV